MHPHRALVIVDVQQAFAPPAAYLEKLRRYSRRFPCRVYTRFLNPVDSLFRRVLKQHSCLPGSADTRLLIEPDPDDMVIDKPGYGLPPKAIDALHKRQISHVTVCGLDTDACVLGVMFSLFDGGIECHLKEDMCWSSSGLHKPALRIARSQFPAPR